MQKPHGGSSRNTQDYLTIQQFHLLVFTRTNKDSSTIWTPVFTTEASPRARAHPDNQINQVWSVHTADCYSALKHEGGSDTRYNTGQARDVILRNKAVREFREYVNPRR